MQPWDLLSDREEVSRFKTDHTDNNLPRKSRIKGVLTYWKERTMAVTIPMIMSKTAAIARNPPQEVKSTCDEEGVISRMKVNALPDAQKGKWRGLRERITTGQMCRAPAKYATASSPVASGREAGFASYHKMS